MDTHTHTHTYMHSRSKHACISTHTGRCGPQQGAADLRTPFCGCHCPPSHPAALAAGAQVLGRKGGAKLCFCVAPKRADKACGCVLVASTHRCFGVEKQQHKGACRVHANRSWQMGLQEFFPSLPPQGCVQCLYCIGQVRPQRRCLLNIQHPVSGLDASGALVQCLLCVERAQACLQCLLCVERTQACLQCLLCVERTQACLQCLLCVERTQACLQWPRGPMHLGTCRTRCCVRLV